MLHLCGTVQKSDSIQVYRNNCTVVKRVSDCSFIVAVYVNITKTVD